jgi:hypothetical protein
MAEALCTRQSNAVAPDESATGKRSTANQSFVTLPLGGFRYLPASMNMNR